MHFLLLWPFMPRYIRDGIFERIVCFSIKPWVDLTCFALKMGKGRVWFSLKQTEIKSFSFSDGPMFNIRRETEGPLILMNKHQQQQAGWTAGWLVRILVISFSLHNIAAVHLWTPPVPGIHNPTYQSLIKLNYTRNTSYCNDLSASTGWSYSTSNCRTE